ncbi:MAG: FAD-dependent oxidoreductase [Bacilli bacterium]|nr:FAD-dependent oxidoreductase [Bacilli bacterium]
MKNESIWKINNRSFKTKELTNDLKTDILIIGGGITGISTAFYLKDKQLDITLIEANEIGSGATLNTTGKITFLQGLIYHKLENIFDFNTSLKYLQSQLDAINLIEANIKKYDINCDYLRNSSYVYTNKDSEIKEFLKEQQFFDKVNLDYKIINKLPDDLDCKYGIKVDNTAIFHPIKYLYKLTEEILKTNVKIYENTPALKIEKLDNHYNIYTSKNIITANKVIIATHYPFFVMPGLIPFKTHLEKEYVLASKIDKIKKYNAITNNNPITSIRYHQDKENYIIFASIESKLSKNLNNEANFKNLIKKFESKFSNKITNLWFTYDLITNDKLPIIGKLKENLYIATGFNKWGMTNGTLAGKILSDLITNENNQYINLFDPEREITMEQIKNFFVDGFTTISSMVDSKINKNKDFYENVRFKKINNMECAIYIDENKREHIVKNKCPHMGCSLIFNNEEKTWDCPCHGSRYDIDGNVIKGPSNKNIKL